MRRVKTGRRRLARQRGFSLIEVMIGLLMMTCALLGLAAAAAVGLGQTSRSRQDSQYWSDAQRIADSLIMRGFNASTSSSTSVNGRPIKWIVGSGASAPQLIQVVVWRTGYQKKRSQTNVVDSRYTSVQDTIVLYLSKPVPGT